MGLKSELAGKRGALTERSREKGRQEKELQTVQRQDREEGEDDGEEEETQEDERREGERCVPDLFSSSFHHLWLRG